ncbi:putative short chain dehydrogenase [Aspergillus mulundensis]|uniref:Ketoreductase domain-containing protein n=1 Tax=Aspergillus mulundensis TaxID=1810919 RepID=A0A3D8QZN8_9EURO|nr:hypothetical protein DSM5745_09139 [Aspergillus mulundensis]RDW67273.1 hypothetical protein DSM5745_09139 [Aspergillus mulundensis]
MSDTRIVLITGANTGIGYQVVRALYSADKAYTVLVGARSLSKSQDAISAIQTEFPESTNKLAPLVVDVESDESIERAHDEVARTFGRVDALVNNAGANFDSLIPSKLSPRQAWNKSWDVNVTGAQVLTSTFIPLLLQSTDPRLLFVTSGTSTLIGSQRRNLPVDRSPEAGWPKSAAGISAASYRSAKTGLNMMMREWERMLKNDGVKVFAISPGFLATGLGGVGAQQLRAFGAGEPEVAGPLFRDVIEGRRDGDVGRVVSRDGVQEW